MSKIIVRFLIDNNPRYAKKLDPSENLSDIRKKCGIGNEYFFQTNDNFNILKEDEKDFNVEDILVDNKNIILRTGEDKLKLNTPKNGSIYIENKNNINLCLYPVDILTKEEEEKAIILMLVGEEGSGKTTILNTYINYLMGIKYEDNFRYVLKFERFNIFKDTSHLSEIIIYNIKTPDGTIIKIIDIPGFGDVKGIENDIKITQKIKRIILDKLNSITCICFIAKSNQSRLTINTKMMLNSILDLFADDVKNNFIFMLTFCDGGKPQYLSILQNMELFKEIIPNTCFYKFNNSGIFEKDIEDKYNSFFYNLSMRSFEEITQRIKELKKISLNKSKKILNEKQNLEKNVVIFQESLNKCIEKIKGDKKGLTEFYNHCNDIQGLIIKEINIIKEIGLNKNVFASTNSIDSLIENESNQRMPGWKKRIEGLNLLKNQKNLLREIYEKKNKELINIKKIIEQN